MKSDLTAVVLAAGISTRFEPFSQIQNKAMFGLGGMPIVKRTVQSVLKFGANRVVLVCNAKNKKALEKALREFGKKIIFVIQNKQNGTGDALEKSASYIKGRFILLNFEHSNIAKDLSAILKTNTEAVVLTYPTDTPSSYGIIKFDKKNKNRVVGIVEKPKPGLEPSKTRTLGIYLLPHKFLGYLRATPPHEHSLIHAINKYTAKNGFRILNAKQKPVSIKYAFDILDAAYELTDGLKKAVAKSAKIAKHAVINGNVVIGKNTVVKERAIIHGPVWIGENCVIGNNVVIRPNTIIENGAQLGTFTEIKASVIGAGTHIHSGYIGDSVIGENCRIGAGFITANRRTDRGQVKFTVKNKVVDSRKTYLGCIVGHNTKIGARASTMPGAIIGNNCVIGSNTEIKGTVPSNSLIYTDRVNIVKKNFEIMNPHT